MAIKTNLLFDLAGVPNVGMEMAFGRRFSAGVDVAYANWQIHNKYTIQTSQLAVGANYWFNPGRRVLSGWHAGAYALYSGRFDVQWVNGYQGDKLFSAGVSGGYSLPVSKRLSVEFNLSAGYVYSPEVRHYHLVNDRLIWEETRYNYSTIALTGAQVNLVWYVNLHKN